MRRGQGGGGAGEGREQQRERRQSPHVCGIITEPSSSSSFIHFCKENKKGSKSRKSKSGILKILDLKI